MPMSRLKESVSKQSSPPVLSVPIRGTLRGEVRWQVLDENMQPEAARSPSGGVIAPAGGVVQSNLITDYGLEQVPVRSVLALDAWRDILAIGTGSIAPAFSDTALNAEVQRGNGNGGFGDGSVSYELDGVANVWRATVTVIRAITMTADRNLTEFGFAPVSGTDLVVRELFRDGVGTPVTISILNGKTIRVDHTLTLEIPAPAAGNAVTIDIEEYDVGNTLVNTISQGVVHGGHQYTTSLYQVFEIWDPSGAPSQGIRRLTSAIAYGRTDTHTNIDPTSNNNSLTSLSLQSYVPSSHARTKRATVGAASGNAQWFGVMFSANIALNVSQNRSGWVVLFDSPASYTKADTDTMQVGLVSSWARA